MLCCVLPAFAPFKSTVFLKLIKGEPLNLKNSRISMFLSACIAGHVHAAGVSGELEEIVVTGIEPPSDLYKVKAASVGSVLQEQIEHRPLLRPAELLETIPGMVVTQHSGAGKANQYFLRGFNLDHGTDFANYLEGVPVNMVSHGHGQGYTDMNFLIPELVDAMVYKKGPYYASEGDFSSAGSARIRYTNELYKNVAKLTIGKDSYHRALVYGGTSLEQGSLVYAVENMKSDGPWINEDDYQKDNLVLKHATRTDDVELELSVLYYDSTWNATDQIPVPLVEQGDLNRYDSLDPTSGGETTRFSFSANFRNQLNDSLRMKAGAYWVDYDLELSTNATYYATDQDRGDQFTQFDDRQIIGGQVVFEQALNDMHTVDYGLYLRNDDIAEVGVGLSEQREIYDITSNSAVDELAWAVYGSVNSQWNDWFATIVGVRYDYMDVDVSSHVDGGVEGSGDDEQASPKLSLRFGPFADTEFFLNYGKGFHSNDARGAVDSDSNVPLISESEGYEAGVRTLAIENLQVTFVWFRLDLDSELVFVGDDATTEPKGATKREGFEIGMYYQPVEWLIMDMDYANSDTRFNTPENGGGHVPDSIKEVVSFGATFDLEIGLYIGIRARYFGPRYLSEDGSIESKSTSLLNANTGYHLDNGVNLGFEIINLLNDEEDDITYYY
ncbi:MAG: TonB-dependent receptor [Pseudomonadales bacterium]|nr:TonB-dependent receptor [Pseudomonadales bacterium]